jgi:hypothetical protein
MRRNLIILANSRKRGNRCIVGIDTETEEWVRPCVGEGEKGIPWHVRQINGAEPQLLDIVAIPLASNGPNREIQPENYTVLKGSWEKVGKVTIKQITKYCQRRGLILHNTDRRIHITELSNVSKRDRKSLCLIHTHVEFSTEATYRGKKRVNATFVYGSNRYCFPVTDYEFERHFLAYTTDEADCLLCISLGLPYEIDDFCYKFVAGVIM